MENEFKKESKSINKRIPAAILPSFTISIAEVLAFGAAKYGRDNWKKCPKDQLYLYWDALYRHLEEYRNGENCDKESELSHLAHAACNLMFIMELEK